jgi:hypothetical protein
MSHHLDAELSRTDSRLDLTDQYVFRGETGTVFVLDVNSSLAEGAPGWHPEGRYEFKVHRAGAEYEDLTYRVAFGPGDASRGSRQRVTLHVLTGPDARDDAA